jgi:hypothetical protein
MVWPIFLLGSGYKFYFLFATNTDFCRSSCLEPKLEELQWLFSVFSTLLVQHPKLGWDYNSGALIDAAIVLWVLSSIMTESLPLLLEMQQKLRTHIFVEDFGQTIRYLSTLYIISLLIKSVGSHSRWSWWCDTLWVTLIRLWLCSLSCYLQIVVVEVSLQIS